VLAAADGGRICCCMSPQALPPPLAPPLLLASPPPVSRSHEDRPGLRRAAGAGSGARPPPLPAAPVALSTHVAFPMACCTAMIASSHCRRVSSVGAPSTQQGPDDVLLTELGASCNVQQ
jgi:hypothetical protein